MTTSDDRFQANQAIIRALGLDAKTIRNGLTIRLDKDLGPIVTVEFFLVNMATGRKEVVSDEVATVLKRYILTPIPDFVEGGIIPGAGKATIHAGERIMRTPDTDPTVSES